MSQPDFQGASEYIANWLREELPPGLYYHGPQHTMEDVLVAAESLADAEGVDGDQRLLLLTAVLFHDTGYAEQYWENEEIGVKFATTALPRFGFDEGQLRIVSELIMATRLPQEPENLLQAIICDADLDSLGRDDFFLASHRLRLELAIYDETFPLRKWYEQQLLFLREHRYFTRSARNLRNAGKQKNIAELQELLYARGAAPAANEPGN